MIGFLYFIVIVLANTVGAISGMGGGVIIKPAFDFIGAHDVGAISFYSATAVFTMSIISTTTQLTSGRKFNWKIVSWVSAGAVLGGILGNIAFEAFLNWFENEDRVQLIQIALTIVTLLFAFMYTKYNWKIFNLRMFLVSCLWVSPRFFSKFIRDWRRSNQCLSTYAAIFFTN